MTFVVSGIIGGGALVGSVVSGVLSSNATNNATNASISEQNKTLSQQQTNNQPYLNLGQSAIGQYQDLLGIGTSGQAGVQSALASTPGYQFSLNQGLTSTENQATAMGLGLSGNTLQGLDQFSTGLADSTYQNAVGNAQGAVGIGQASAAGQAADIGTAGSNISNALVNQGNNIAGIDSNTIAGLTKAGSSFANNYITANTLAGLGGAGGGGATFAGGGGVPGMYEGQ